MGPTDDTSARTPADGQPPSRRPLLILALVAALIIMVVGAIALATRHGASGPPFTGRLSPPGGGRHQRVTAWLTSTSPSLDAALAARALDEIDCDWYTIGADGTVGARSENLGLVARVRSRGLQVLATVTNRPDSRGSFTGAIARDILSSPTTERHAVQSLVQLAVSKGYDGIDIDWELVPLAERDAFSRFMGELAAALHAQHRLLSVAVFPKTSEPGRWDSQKVFDYKALGAAVDELKIMTYSYSGPWGSPGPQAPLAWTRAVLSFAETLVPARKIYMGLPFYGFDWHGGTATALQAADVAALVAAHHLSAAHDVASGEADLSYTDSQGHAHVLWFQDRRSIAAKVSLLHTQLPRIGGLAIWQLGGEDPGFWGVIDQTLTK
jgi:spore germination protein YaaH